jgi:hypothetical protein
MNFNFTEKLFAQTNCYIENTLTYDVKFTLFKQNDNAFILSKYFVYKNACI